MTDIARQEQELNRFWNELLTPGIDPDARGLSAEEAETLRRLHHMTQASLPGTVLLRVDHGVQPSLDRSPDDVSGDVSNGLDAEHWAASSWSTFASPARSNPDASSRRAPSTFFARGPFTRLSQLAATLLLLAALGGLFLWLAPGGERARPSAVLPALPGVVVGETMLTLTVPAEMLPHDGRSFGSLSDYSLPAGTEASWEAANGACCPGLRMVYVMEGSMSILAHGGGHVVRAGFTLEPALVPPGAAVTLDAGDAMMLGFEDAFTSGNPGAEPARFLQVTFIDGFSPLNTAPIGWVWHPDTDMAYGLAIPNQPATLRLFQAVLDAGASLAPPPGAIAQLGVTVADNLPLGVQETHEIANVNDEPVTVHVATLVPVADEGGGGKGG